MEFKIDGISVFASTGGRDFDPAQPPIVFIHGAGNDHSVWQMPARYFAYHGRSVLAVDLPGHGRSDGNPIATVEGLAAWIVKLADTLAMEKLSLVGHSLGALVALAAAASMPERMISLALLGVAARMPVHPDLLDAARRNDHRAIDLITTWGFSHASQFGGNRVPGMWMTGGGTRLLERIPDGVLGNDLAACDGFDGASELARRVTCPTLFLLGARDQMIPAKNGRELAQRISGAKTVVLSDCGHSMLSERPNETLDALREVL